MENITLTEDQSDAVDRICDWWDGAHSASEFSFGGFAGTGKTTVVNHVREALGKGNGVTTAVLTPTGKAAHVLRGKGVNAETIHSFLYNYRGKVLAEDEQGREREELVFEDKEDIDQVDLLIVDEASMVNTRLASDLRAVRCPILWVGDHGQLAPIGGDPGIMSDLDARLEKIHRQAEDNPILRVAHRAREGHSPVACTDLILEGDERLRIGRSRSNSHTVGRAIECDIDQIIVPYHNIRIPINSLYREAIGFDQVINEGDKVICWKNNRRKSLFNGMLFTVSQVLADWEDHVEVDLIDDCGHEYPSIKIDLRTLMEEDEPGYDPPQSFDQFKFGYAITYHKSQGSEWDRVLCVDRYSSRWDMNRLRYTGFTRPREQLVVAVG